MVELSIVVPAYNEDHVVKDVITGILSQLKSLGYNSHNSELILVDDGSTDNTYSEVLKVEGIKIIRHENNRGYGASLKTGISAADFENIIILDADGQHDPKYIPQLLELGKNSDMVVATRKGFTHSQIIRLPGKLLMLALATGLAYEKIPDLNCGYRLLKKSIIMLFLDLLCNGFSFSTTSTIALICSGHKINYLEVECKKREQGKSQVTLYAGLRTLLYILQMFMAFKPLRLFIPVTLMFLMAGLSLFTYEFILYRNIGEITVLLLTSAVSCFLVGLVADQIASLRQQFIKINSRILFTKNETP